jgi:hypothetical protein
MVSLQFCCCLMCYNSPGWQGEYKTSIRNGYFLVSPAMEGGTLSTLFFILALISVACGIATSIMIASFLSERGVKINYLFIRLFIFRYVRQYRRITMEETGKPGPLFYWFITAWNLALVFAIVGIILELT